MRNESCLHEVEMKKKLNNFTKNYNQNSSLTPSDWLRYYDFIVSSFHVPQGIRPTVSELASLFRNLGIEKPGSLAMIYAHGLYILARSNNLEIFKGGFNY
ncbi:hypothetical protein M3175_20895 [Robertmurraya korlensis]|uniref:hypothetical protein n=1 Tax=Robertmurraya korlensis TaxID=519977 RepID=UPI00203C1F77|nr:hypothetical protein [Robertmurraya korlensis]MCM3603200.1 hypothetical protein [Robertmurraya korlensis]